MFGVDIWEEEIEYFGVEGLPVEFFSRFFGCFEPALAEGGEGEVRARQKVISVCHSSGN